MRFEDAIVATLPCLTLPLQMYDATQLSAAHLPKGYSAECVEEVFCELRPNGVLRSSPPLHSRKFATRKQLQATAKIVHLGDTPILRRLDTSAARASRGGGR